MAADPDLADDVAVAFEAQGSIDKAGRRAGARKIDEHPDRIRNLLVVEHDLAVELDRHADGIRENCSPDVFDHGETTLVARRRGRSGGLRSLVLRSKGQRLRLDSRQLLRYLLRELALVVGARELVQKTDAGVAILRVVEPLKCIELETAGLPQGVVAVAAG